MSKLTDEFDTAYAEYVDQNMKRPEVAYVKVKWDDDGETSDSIETIVINGVDALANDEDILYYCNSVAGLRELTTSGSGADFIVTELIGFDSL